MAELLILRLQVSEDGLGLAGWQMALVFHSGESMRWTPGGLSKNIEDRRGSSGGGFGMAPMGIGGAIILLVLSLVFGVDLSGNGGGGGSPIPQSSGGEVSGSVAESPEEHQLVQFVSFVLD